MRALLLNNFAKLRIKEKLASELGHNQNVNATIFTAGAARRSGPRVRKNLNLLKYFTSFWSDLFVNRSGAPQGSVWGLVPFPIYTIVFSILL
jgi:hypothetical protein